MTRKAVATDVPMFDLDPQDAGRFPVERTPPPRSVAAAPCPGCRSGGRGPAGLVGLLRQGEHLVWREHTYTTWSGARLTCPASGIAVCVLKPRLGFVDYLDPAKPAKCRHPAPERDTTSTIGRTS